MVDIVSLIVRLTDDGHLSDNMVD